MTGPRTIRKHIHITGVSGSGVTTLGRALSKALGFAHLDTDDFSGCPPIRLIRQSAHRNSDWRCCSMPSNMHPPPVGFSLAPWRGGAIH
jgi:uridine kinase